MAFRLELRFPSAAQLEEHLSRYQERGGVIIPERLCPDLPVPGLPDGVELHFVVGGQRAVARGQAQRKGRMGVMVEIRQEALQDAWRLVARAGGRRLRTPQEIEGGRPVPLGRLAGVRPVTPQGVPTPLGGVEERMRPAGEPERDKEKLWERYMSIDSQDLPPASITPVEESPRPRREQLRTPRDRELFREGQTKATVGELRVKPVSLWEQETEVREQRPAVEVAAGLVPVVPVEVVAGPAVVPVEVEPGPALEPMEVVELSLEDVVPPGKAAEGSDPGAGQGRGEQPGGTLGEVVASGQTPVDAPEDATPSQLRRRIRQGELQLGGLIWLEELGAGVTDVDGLPVPAAEGLLPARAASVTSADTALNLEEAAALVAEGAEVEGEGVEGEIPGPIFELTLEAMIAASSDPVPEGSAATVAGEPSVVRRRSGLEPAALVESGPVVLALAADAAATAISIQLVAGPQQPIAEPQQPIAEPQQPIAEPQQPIAEPQPPIAEPQPPIAEPQQPIAEPQPPIGVPQSPMAYPQQPTMESAFMAESPPAPLDREARSAAVADLSAVDLLRLACQPERRQDQDRVLQLIHHPQAGRALRVRLLGRLDLAGLLAVAQTPDLPAYLHEAAVQRLSRLALPVADL